MFRILGALEVEGEAGPVALVGHKQRVLLGLLLLHTGEVVSSDRLMDELWGERPPATAATSLRNLVAQLRRRLGAATIVTQAPGYLLRVEPEQLDRARFERLIAEARGAEPREQVMLLREALALWRGPPLADLSYERFAQAEIHRLEELRLEALEERIEAELVLGEGGELVAELEGLVAEQPLRERLRGQLMLALYRAGRQAEALDAYQAARRMLVEELGVEPSPTLQELQGAILRQDPALSPAPPAPTTKLPAQPTPFLGRTLELAEVVALLQRADVRLLTLTGAGGSGKTRLALHAASDLAPDYPHGVFWVPLASLRDSELVSASIADALAVTDERRLAESIGERRLLLLVDNCEHLLAAAPALSALLSACPNLKLLATSREPLHLAGEREYLVPTLAENEAVELFRQRAHAAEPEPAVLAICRRLDCLPLAVELAAARTKLLPPEALLQRLEKRLPLLTGGPRDAPERQRTLEATIAWSYDLLSEDEQTLFARLAVFASGSTLEAAEEVAGAELDTLQSLVDKNLVRHSNKRYEMLETMREYASERLNELGERNELHHGLAEYLVGFVERSDMTAAERTRLVPVLNEELDNLRGVLAFLLQTGDIRLALRLANRAHLFSMTPGEQTRWLDQALRDTDDISDRLRVDALVARARVAFVSGDFATAERFGQRALMEYRRLGAHAQESRALRRLGRVAVAAGNFEQARTLLERALEAAERPVDRYYALHALAELELHRGNVGAAENLFSRSADLARESDDRRLTTNILHAMGDVALERNDPAAAAASYQETLRLCKDFGFVRGPAYCAAGLAAAAASAGNTHRAGELWGGVERLERELGFPVLPHDKARYEKHIRKHTDSASGAFSAAVEAGRRRTIEDIYAYALGA
jgi:predicted ATPase/DNA-binding SARP family transcriptional activator